jgi:hypothetical protein
MQRREFIVGPGAAITGSIQTDAQELRPVPLVGYLDRECCGGVAACGARAAAGVARDRRFDRRYERLLDRSFFRVFARA